MKLKSTLLPFLGLLFVLLPEPARATADGALQADQCAAFSTATPVPTTLTVDPALTGTPWRLAELLETSLPEEAAAPYLLLTKEGELVGFGGCNYFFGRYRLDQDGKLVVSSLKASHRQCPEPAELEPNLLTSLLLANGLQVSDERLTFFLNGKSLMHLEAAPEISTEELTRQGKLLKAKKTRKTKAKKKKATGKAKKGAKKPPAKATAKKPPTATPPARKK